MKNFIFLTEEQIFGNNQLDILKIYGTKCAITDFSILLGGYVPSDYHTSEGNSRKDCTGYWWTKTPWDNYARVVSSRGISRYDDVTKRSGGARPVLPYSSISSFSSNGVKVSDGILEVEYGEYPQDIVPKDFARTLERAYSNRTINQTGKSYTTDSVRYQDTETPFQARTHIEYEYNGKKYIRFVGDSNCSGEILSDGRTIQDGSPYWVEVKPIKWMIDKRANIALSKKIIFSGVQFNCRKNYRGEFRKTTIYNFLNTIFAKDIIPSKIEEKVNKQNKIEQILNEIGLSIEYLENKEEIINEVNKIIVKYNNKLDLIRKNRNDESINLSLDTVESITQNLEFSLRMILERFKSSSNYLDIINYIDKCLVTLNNQEENNTNDDKLIEDLTVLIKHCLPFLKEEDQVKIKGDALKIFNEEKNKIKNYLNIKYSGKEESKLNYSNKDEFIVEIRKKLLPILENLNDKAKKRNIELEISSALNDIINHTFDSSKNKELSVYLSEINNLITKINGLLQSVKNERKKQVYNDKMSKIISTNINYNKNVEGVLKQIRTIVISLHKLSLDIQEYLKDIQIIDDSYISTIKR